MHDWNVVVTVREGAFVRACRLLQAMGRVHRTEFFNVLVMRSDDPEQLPEWLRGRMADDPEAGCCIARLVPLTSLFNFQSPGAFEENAVEAVSRWVPGLGGKSFHVRMCRRGFKGRLSSMDEERFLDEYLLGTLEKAGAPGRLSFDDPDFIIAVETVGTRAGLSLWNRDDLRRYPFLGLD